MEDKIITDYVLIKDLIFWYSGHLLSYKNFVSFVNPNNLYTSKRIVKKGTNCRLEFDGVKDFSLITEDKIYFTKVYFLEEFMEYFITLSEFREQRINSILNG